MEIQSASANINALFGADFKFELFDQSSLIPGEAGGYFRLNTQVSANRRQLLITSPQGLALVDPGSGSFYGGAWIECDDQIGDDKSPSNCIFS